MYPKIIYQEKGERKKKRKKNYVPKIGELKLTWINGFD